MGNNDIIGIHHTVIGIGDHLPKQRKLVVIHIKVDGHIFAQFPYKLVINYFLCPPGLLKKRKIPRPLPDLVVFTILPLPVTALIMPFTFKKSMAFSTGLFAIVKLLEIFGF